MGDAYFYKRGIGSQNNIWQVGGRGEYVTRILPKTYMHFQAAGTIKFPFNQPYYSNGLFGSSDFYLRGLEYYVINGAAGALSKGYCKKRNFILQIQKPHQ